MVIESKYNKAEVFPKFRYPLSLFVGRGKIGGQERVIARRGIYKARC